MQVGGKRMSARLRPENGTNVGYYVPRNDESFLNYVKCASC